MVTAKPARAQAGGHQLGQDRLFGEVLGPHHHPLGRRAGQRQGRQGQGDDQDQAAGAGDRSAAPSRLAAPASIRPSSWSDAQRQPAAATQPNSTSTQFSVCRPEKM